DRYRPRRRRERRQPLFQLGDPRQRRIPTPLERLADQPVFRLHRVVLPLGALRLVAGLAEFQLERSARRVRLGVGLIGRGYRGLDRAGGDDAEDLALDRLVDAQRADADTAAPQPAGQLRPTTLIPGRRPRSGPRRHHLQPPATVPAPYQPGHQTLAAAHRPLRHRASHVGVVRQHLLVALVAVPGNIGFVMVPQQHRPLFAPLATPAPLAGAAAVDLRVRSRAPEGVGAGVDRILQTAQDGAVDRQTPLELNASGTVGLDDRERYIVLATPQQHLPRAAQGREALEDQRDGLLHALIRILLHAVLGRA